MRKGIIIPVITFLLLACNKDNSNLTTNACKDDPFEARWLNDIRESLNNCNCDLGIYKGKYETYTVFFVADLNRENCSIIYLTALYDCEGTLIHQYSGEDIDSLEVEVSSRTLLYECPRN